LWWIDEHRTKLPLTFIGSGKTDAVEEGHFSQVGSHRTDHSESGWMTTEAFQRWLALDDYSVHPQKATRQEAAELAVYLLSVPADLAEERQPVGPLCFRDDESAQSPKCNRTHTADIEPTNKQITARFLIRAWEAVNAAVVNDTWARDEELEEDQQ
jgi:hypothetical protein